MRHRLVGGFLIVVAGGLLLVCLAGVISAWAFNEPLTRRGLVELQSVDGELALAQAALDGAATELRRALRILNGAEAALQALSRSTSRSQETLQGVGQALDDHVIPGLRSAGGQLDQVKGALQSALATLEAINASSLLPVPIPGEEWLAGLLAATGALNDEIADLEDLATRASTFLADVEYVLGGDFDETRAGLEGLLSAVTDYQARVAGWRAQVAEASAELPGIVDGVSVVLTMVLLWIGISQGGMLLHGWELWRGRNPLAGLRRPGSIAGA
jgi:hypothetical protein